MRHSEAVGEESYHENTHTQKILRGWRPLRMTDSTHHCHSEAVGEESRHENTLTQKILRAKATQNDGLYAE